MSDAEDDSEVMKVEDMSAKANEDLARLCGSEEMASRVKKLWEELMDKKRLDVSKEKLSDTEIGMLLKGLYSMARTTGFQTERMKPLPITELDFSGNELTAKGIDEVVQFARTAGANASLVDLSDNRLDDAATNELARLVKNYKCAAAIAPVTVRVGVRVRVRVRARARARVRVRATALQGEHDALPLVREEGGAQLRGQPLLVRVRAGAGLGVGVRVLPRPERSQGRTSPPAHQQATVPHRTPPTPCPLSSAARSPLRSCWVSCCSMATRSAGAE